MPYRIEDFKLARTVCQRSKKSWRFLFVFLFALANVLIFDGFQKPANAGVLELELYPNFHTMGVIVILDENTDPERNAETLVEYRTGGASFRQGFRLSRITEELFVGSLFWLEPNITYEVKVTFSDPDGGDLDGVLVEGTQTTRAEVQIPEPTMSYYVTPDGEGSECSFETPCSFEDALDQVQPGEAVVMREGNYYIGEMTISRSGTEGSPIIIKGYENETAVFNGANPDSDKLTWKQDQNGVYFTEDLVEGNNPHLVIAEGKRLFPYIGLDELREMSRSNMPGLYVEDGILYVHLENDADPVKSGMIISHYNHAFSFERDFIYFTNLTFAYYGDDSYSKVLYFNHSNDNLVQNCIFKSNDLGIGVKGNSNRNLFQDNEFYDDLFNWPWQDVKEVKNMEDGAIVFFSPSEGRGNVFRRNIVHDDFDGLVPCPVGSATALTEEIDIYENVIYNMADDGMAADGRCRNVRLWNNTIHDVLMGISMAPITDGPVFAIRNLVYKIGVGNNVHTGSPFKFNNADGHSGPIYLMHNTADANYPGNNGLYIKSPGTWELIYSRNNIWSGTDYALNDYNNTQLIDFNYDDLYTTDSTRLIAWDDDGTGMTYFYDLPSFQVATGLEEQGLNVFPDFLEDYRLSPTSPLIDKGEIIPGINDDYQGSAPDIGAFESLSSARTSEYDLDETNCYDGTCPWLTISVM